MKGRARSHSIWSPGSLCEQEMKSVVDSKIKPESIVNTVIKSTNQVDTRWRWDPSERENQTKTATIGPSGEKTFTVSLQFYYFFG